MLVGVGRRCPMQINTRGSAKRSGVCLVMPTTTRPVTPSHSFSGHSFLFRPHPPQTSSLHPPTPSPPTITSSGIPSIKNIIGHRYRDIKHHLHPIFTNNHELQRCLVQFVYVNPPPRLARPSPPPPLQKKSPQTPPNHEPLAREPKISLITSPRGASRPHRLRMFPLGDPAQPRNL